MPVRTYLPGIIALARAMCRFIDRYETQIRANLPSEYIPTFEALQTACDAFDAIIPFITPAPGD